MSGRPQLCPKCRKLVGASSDRCHHCGANVGLRGRLVAGLGRSATGVGQEMPWWRIVVMLNIGLYIVGLAVTFKAGGGLGGGGVMGLLAASDSVQLQLGLQTTPLVLSGDWWRLITCLFLHAGLIHLGFNMYFLAQLGPTAERIFGNRGFLLVYLLGGLAGSLVELALGRPVLGASGSIMAVIGALGALGWMQNRTWDNPMTREMLRILAFVTIFGLVMGSVAHGAHIGGFIGGGLVLILVRKLQQSRQHKLLDGFGYATAALVVLSFGSMAIASSRPSVDELRQYERCVISSIKQFTTRGAAMRPDPCLRRFEGLGEEPEAVLRGIEKLIEKPDRPGGPEALKALYDRHLLWLKGEVEARGIGR